MKESPFGEERCQRGEEGVRLGFAVRLNLFDLLRGRPAWRIPRCDPFVISRSCFFSLPYSPQSPAISPTHPLTKQQPCPATSPLALVLCSWFLRWLPARSFAARRTVAADLRVQHQQQQQQQQQHLLAFSGGTNKDTL